MAVSTFTRGYQPKNMMEFELLMESRWVVASVHLDEWNHEWNHEWNPSESSASLVGGDWNMIFVFAETIGNFIIPIDEL